MVLSSPGWDRKAKQMPSETICVSISNSMVVGAGRWQREKQELHVVPVPKQHQTMQQEARLKGMVCHAYTIATSPHTDFNSTGFVISCHTLHGVINLLVLFSQFSIVRYVFLLLY